MPLVAYGNQIMFQHHALGAMLEQYIGQGILLDPRIQFGRHHTYNTRCPSHFAEITQCKLPRCKHHFRQKATSWWNSLPPNLFSDLSSFQYTA